MLTTNRIRPYAIPWKLLNQVHDDINRELSDWFGSTAPRCPSSLEVWTRGDEALVVLDLPGHDLVDIDVSVHRDVLTIAAKPAGNDIPESAKVLLRERSSESLQRQVQLPFEMDPQRVEATYEHGQLAIRVWAHESTQPARIEVKAG